MYLALARMARASSYFIQTMYICTYVYTYTPLHVCTYIYSTHIHTFAHASTYIHVSAVAFLSVFVVQCVLVPHNQLHIFFA